MDQLVFHVAKSCLQSKDSGAPLVVPLGAPLPAEAALPCPAAAGGDRTGGAVRLRSASTLPPSMASASHGFATKKAMVASSRAKLESSNMPVHTFRHVELECAVTTSFEKLPCPSPT
mmetsp:Transcript_52010/g.166574  ORF Transcript_52010/g.166574 Transcript_52010/m.166574 type:complete len:117 (-) Transcript_52010:273-623(-)